MTKNKLTGLSLLVAGAGIGAAVALLFAPASGQQTRRRLRKAADQTLDRVEEMREDLRACMSDWVEETSETIAAGIASGKETVKDGGERVLRTLNKCMEDGRERVEKFVRSLAS